MYSSSVESNGVRTSLEKLFIWKIFLKNIFLSLKKFLNFFQSSYFKPNISRIITISCKYKTMRTSKKKIRHPVKNYLGTPLLSNKLLSMFQYLVYQLLKIFIGIIKLMNRFYSSFASTDNSQNVIVMYRSAIKIENVIFRSECHG